MTNPAPERLRELIEELRVSLTCGYHDDHELYERAAAAIRRLLVLERAWSKLRSDAFRLDPINVYADTADNMLAQAARGGEASGGA